MEDILASIRRIIADDQSQGTRPGFGNGARRGSVNQAPAVEAEKSDARARTAYDDVLDLARLSPAAVPDQSYKSTIADQRTPAVENPHVASRQASLPAVEEPPQDPERDRFAEPQDERPSSLRARLPEPAGRTDVGPSESTQLVAFEDDSAGETLISEPLGASVMSAFETLAATVVLQNTPMLEGVMRDLLRPMLKTWLDDNLPALVERLVRTEIERVARGPRG